ncbi:40S ribosomal S13 [Tubulinosema ratisbonensis]|uniref:40S ribosomal S13 n=1 Tax=Tubulinosema ratisbonensis TaxID=291195 RepID=A0A437AN99_9MICR|nr:40S ribosomal S13 [Tubulinosema ratisbonensis]
MARMHTSGKGVSGSTKPYHQIRPSWVTKTPQEIRELILTLAKKGIKPTEIGKILRDEHGIGSVKPIIGKNLLKFLKEESVSPSIPEELDSCVRRCMSIRSHLSVFKNDKNAKYRLILAESKMYRIIRHYKKTMEIPHDYKPYAGLR